MHLTPTWASVQLPVWLQGTGASQLALVPPDARAVGGTLEVYMASLGLLPGSPGSLSSPCLRSGNGGTERRSDLLGVMQPTNMAEAVIRPW